MRRSSRAVVTLTLVVVMASAAVGIATAGKTAQQCKDEYDSRTRGCYASSDTTHMDTFADVQRCLSWVKNHYNVCLANATAPPASLDPNTGNTHPKFGAFTPGLLDHGVHSSGGGPAGAGSPVHAAPAVTAAPPSIR